MDEVGLIKTVAIALFIFELVAYLLSYFTLTYTTQAQGLPIPSLNGTIAFENTINNTATGLTKLGVQNLTTNGLIKPLQAINSTSVLSSVQNTIIAVENVPIYLINIISLILYVVISIIFLFLTGMAFVVYVTFIFLPALLSVANVAGLGFLFQLGYYLMVLVLIVYAFRYLTSFTGRFLGGK